MSRPHYLMAVSWVGNSSIHSIWLSQPQDLIIYTLCSAPDFIIKKVFKCELILSVSNVSGFKIFIVTFTKRDILVERFTIFSGKP